MIFEDSCWLTLTYDPEHLPENGSLTKGKGSHFQKFMKALRKKAHGTKAVDVEVTKKDGTIIKELRYPIRFFQCGEYGDKYRRPHHHACIFNYDFPDKKFWVNRKGFPYYRSELLESVWTYGNSEIGKLTYAAAAYVGRYVTKKFLGKGQEDYYKRVNKETGEIYQLTPEYVTMSLRPGIGYYWLEKFGKTDIYGKDYLTYDGKKFKAPKYYDKKMSEKKPELMERIKNERELKASRVEPTPMARKFQEKRCKELQARKLKRSMENDLINV